MLAKRTFIHLVPSARAHIGGAVYLSEDLGIVSDVERSRVIWLESIRALHIERARVVVRVARARYEEVFMLQ